MYANQWYIVTTNEKGGKREQKSSSKAFPHLLTPVGRWCLCWKYGLGGEGFGREVMLVREGSRVGWIEETQRRTMGCILKEGSDNNHVSFSSPTSCSLLCYCANNAFIWASLALKQRHVSRQRCWKCVGRVCRVRIKVLLVKKGVYVWLLLVLDHVRNPILVSIPDLN